uniref:NADH-ubiquinone oxidoreductase chain 2 n=1 Tax=Celleporella hyalina TaxID=60593 RepID=I6Q0X1_9BILA|nr:NADH dehydrogenase subunit 2 [Celleporella hyalina]AFJ53892.1 NADH dehydrogenase subunit 2 [Celleporella hyalina]
MLLGFYFFFSLFSIMLIMSANNWFIYWMSFEISVISFLPMISTTSSKSVETMVKYYIIQAMGSYVFLFSNIFKLGSFTSFILMTMSLTMKLGLFPFMFWVPAVMANISWMTLFFISTIQKLNPMIVLHMLNNNDIIIYVTVSSVFFSSLMASNQTNLRKLMAFSSISHTSFIIISGYISNYLIMMYVCIYMFMTGMLFSVFYKSNMNNTTSWKKNKKKNILILALAGLPPFPIFFIKVIMFFYISTISPILLFFIMAGSLMSMYFYFILVFPSLL